MKTQNSEEPKTVTKQPSASDGVIELVQPLEHKYTVWAMVKQQKQYQTEDMSETYQSSNKPVARFATVGEFWEVYTHFRRPAVMPLGTFLHFVSRYDALCSRRHSLVH